MTNYEGDVPEGFSPSTLYASSGMPLPKSVTLEPLEAIFSCRTNLREHDTRRDYLSYAVKEILEGRPNDESSVPSKIIEITKGIMRLDEDQRKTLLQGVPPTVAATYMVYQQASERNALAARTKHDDSDPCKAIPDIETCINVIAESLAPGAAMPIVEGLRAFQERYHRASRIEALVNMAARQLGNPPADVSNAQLTYTHFDTTVRERAKTLDQNFILLAQAAATIAQNSEEYRTKFVPILTRLYNGAHGDLAELNKQIGLADGLQDEVKRLDGDLDMAIAALEAERGEPTAALTPAQLEAGLEAIMLLKDGKERTFYLDASEQSPPFRADRKPASDENTGYDWTQDSE